MLAAIAFIPIAVAVRIENVELFMALAIVLGLGRWPWLFSISALVKASPGLGLVYLALQRRWRDLGLAIAVGGGITVVSFLVAPHLWSEWLGAIAGRADMVGNSIVPVPYWVRALTGLGLALVAGILGQRRGETPAGLRRDDRQSRPVPAGLVVLAAVIPIWRAGPEGLASRRRARGAGQVKLCSGRRWMTRR